MRFFQFGQFELPTENNYYHCSHDKDQKEDQIVEIVHNHIESFVRGCSYHEIIRTVAKDKDGGLHICRTEDYWVEIGEGEVVAEVEGGIEGK